METSPQQSSIDTSIFKLKKRNLEWDDILTQVNQQYKTNYSLQDLTKRYEIMTSKVSSEQLKRIFEEFQNCQTNYREIASRTDISVFQVKQQIMAGLANNIAKVCLIVRKRKISTLKNNFISNNKIKELVISMLKSAALKKIKEQYSVLWRFISQHYEDSYYQTVSNEEYTIIYRELIILAESLQINTYEQDHNEEVNPDSFEKKIIKIKQPSIEITPNLLDFIKSSSKKSEQEMINLVSDDQNSDHNGQNEQIFVEGNSEPQVKEQMQDEQQQLQQNHKDYYLRESILVRYNLHILEQRRVQQPQNQELKNELLQSIVKLGSLNLLSSNSDRV